MEPAREDTPGLIGALDFKVSNSAKYITSSRQASFYAPGDRFSAAASRVIRINISGSGYLDLSSLVLAATATNEAGAGNFVPLTETTANLWSRMTLSCGGAICEDTNKYGRLCQLLSMFESASKRTNNHSIGWGTAAIAHGASREICHVPASGLCACGKWLPLDFRQGGLTFTFELAPTGEAWNTSGTNSTSCVLTNVRMLGTVAPIGSELHSAYASYILNESGRLQISHVDVSARGDSVDAVPRSRRYGEAGKYVYRAPNSECLRGVGIHRSFKMARRSTARCRRTVHAIVLCGRHIPEQRPCSRH